MPLFLLMKESSVSFSNSTFPRRSNSRIFRSSLVVSKKVVALPHRDGGAPEIEVVRGLRLRRQGKGAGKTEACYSGHRTAGTDERAARGHLFRRGVAAV